MTPVEEHLDEESNWPRLLRGSLLSSVVSKHTQYVGHADRRAQGMITLNSILAPIAITGLNQSDFIYASLIVLCTSICTIGCCIMCLYPKRYVDRNHGGVDLLHFSHIALYSEDEYLQKMKGLITDTSTLSEMVVHDLYHLSKNVLTPKFLWLKRSYLTFFLGNLIAVLLIVGMVLL